GLVYFAGPSGPGVDGSAAGRDAASKYLIPRDAAPEGLPGSGLTLREIEKTIEQTLAARTLLILDTCFSGAGTFLPTGPESALFTRPLIKALTGDAADTRGAVTVERLIDYVQQHVSRGAREQTGRPVPLATHIDARTGYHWLIANSA